MGRSGTVDGSRASNKPRRGLLEALGHPATALLILEITIGDPRWRAEAETC